MNLEMKKSPRDLMLHASAASDSAAAVVGVAAAVVGVAAAAASQVALRFVVAMKPFPSKKDVSQDMC